MCQALDLTLGLKRRRNYFVINIYLLINVTE
jgi:hypothetical protein